MNEPSPIDLLSRPFISVSEYRALIRTREDRKKTIRVLRALEDQYPGFIAQGSSPKSKIWICVPELLKICPALARKYNLSSQEYQELTQRIDELQREIDLLGAF